MIRVALVLSLLSSAAFAQTHERVFSFRDKQDPLAYGTVVLGEGACVRGPITVTVRGRVVYKLQAGESVNCPIR